MNNNNNNAQRHVPKRCKACRNGHDLNTGNQQRQPSTYPHKYWTNAVDLNCVIGGTVRISLNFGAQQSVLCPGGHRVGYFYPNTMTGHRYQFDNRAVY